MSTPTLPTGQGGMSRAGKAAGAGRTARGAAPVPALVPTWAVRLKPLPMPDWLDEAAALAGRYLLTDDGTPLTARLASLLVDHGRAVTVLSCVPVPGGADTVRPAGVEWIALPDGAFDVGSAVGPEMGAGAGGGPGLTEASSFTEQHLARVVADLTARHGRIANVVHLSPPAGRSADPFSVHDAAMVRRVFGLAGLLQRSLTEAAVYGTARFVTVSRLDGLLGQSGDGGSSPLVGGLAGLVRSVDAAWPAVWCRAIDIAPSVSAVEAARLILAELHDPSRLVTEVGHGPAGRVTLVGA